MMSLRVPLFAGLLCAAFAGAQVNDAYEHALNGGRKRLARRIFNHALFDFNEALTVHAENEQEKAKARLGVGDCYRLWTHYDHARERYVMMPKNCEKARDAYGEVLQMHGATGPQRSRAQLNIGLCLSMEGKIWRAVRAFRKVLKVDDAAPGDIAGAQRQLRICLQDSRDGATTVPEPDLAAAYRGVRPESTSGEGGDTFFTHDALGGTLARDHQSRAMFYAGKHRRTYVAYLDHHFMARVTYYDHDTKSWAWRPEVVDQCQDSYCFKDGHNAPNIFVSRDGTIHLFYGSHGSVLKYARSVDPECIKQFQIGMRIGRRVTYPYLCQRKNGELLLFYRRSGPRGGYYHGHLALRRSSDNGNTWSDIHVLLRVEGGTKLCNNAVVYNAARDRVHIMPTVKSTSGWNSYYLEYDPESSRLFSMDGTDLGTLTTEEVLGQTGG